MANASHASHASRSPGDALLAYRVPYPLTLRVGDAIRRTLRALRPAVRVPKEKDAIHEEPEQPRVRWVTYSFVVYHAADEGLEPLCGAPTVASPRLFHEIDQLVLRRLLIHRNSHLCRACSRLTADRPPWADPDGRPRP